jgi:hypothetical protein
MPLFHRVEPRGTKPRVGQKDRLATDGNPSGQFLQKALSNPAVAQGTTRRNSSERVTPGPPSLHGLARHAPADPRSRPTHPPRSARARSRSTSPPPIFRKPPILAMNGVLSQQAIHALDPMPQGHLSRNPFANRLKLGDPPSSAATTPHVPLPPVSHATNSDNSQASVLQSFSQAWPDLLQRLITKKEILSLHACIFYSKSYSYIYCSRGNIRVRGRKTEDRRQRAEKSGSGTELPRQHLAGNEDPGENLPGEWRLDVEPGEPLQRGRLADRWSIPFRGFAGSFPTIRVRPTRRRSAA